MQALGTSCWTPRKDWVLSKPSQHFGVGEHTSKPTKNFLIFRLYTSYHRKTWRVFCINVTLCWYKLKGFYPKKTHKTVWCAPNISSRQGDLEAGLVSALHASKWKKNKGRWQFTGKANCFCWTNGKSWKKDPVFRVLSTHSGNTMHIQNSYLQMKQPIPPRNSPVWNYNPADSG